MAQATRTEIWEAPIEKIYEAIVDYASYPQFVAGVHEVEILESSDGGARVKYSLNVIKKISYILKLTHQKPHRIDWVLESGDIFKQNDGTWELKDLGEGKTEVTYGLEVNIKGFVPKAIVNGLTSKNLPAMMKSFHDRSKEL